ncbi:MAG: hypothetical protein E7057_06460 [Lentisphaerae bacterium]|nr:hypothetical protein [Lentisphaerota bacterium]
MKTAKITIDNNTFVLENRWMRRELLLNDNGIITTSFTYEGQELLKHIHHEFQVSIDRQLVSGYSEKVLRTVDGNMEENSCDIAFIKAESSVPDEHYQQLDLHFSYGENIIVLRYEIAEKLPSMRKRVLITAGSREILLESLIFDDTPITPGNFSDCDVYCGMDKTPAPNSFTRCGDTDFLRIYNPAQQLGYFLGNTAPGLLRYFLVYPDWYNICVGYNSAGAPFAKYLAPGETFISAESVTCFYRGAADSGVDLWRETIRTRLPQLAAAADIMYCSWIPQYKNISEKIICDLAKTACDAGFTFFVIDDGWFMSSSDWQIEPEKFPNGLKPVADYIHLLGMKFGLWFNIGTDYGMKSEREKFAARQADGTLKKLGWNYQAAVTAQCFGSGHCERMRDKLDELAEKYDVDYFKMDFSTICSPYGIMPFGCHAHDHAHHKGFADSFNAMYDGFFRMRRELKAKHPELMLDFSFETFGLETPSIAALECSELNHLTNLSGLNPENQQIVKIRRDFYANAASLPPERLMHGLPVLSGDTAVEYFLTSLCGAPLVSGNLQTLSSRSRERLPLLSKAYREFAAKHFPGGFEVILDAASADGFRRYSSDGAEMRCIFNRSDTELVVDAPGFFNAETGCSGITVPPHDCAMFIKQN